MLRIAVCIKQIPLIEQANFDTATKTIRRDGRNVISAFDLRAIAMGVKLAQEQCGTATVISMGPPQAREALQEALAMGIGTAVLLSDRAFAGADTLATARTLAAWLNANPQDLILLGKYSLDADTGQVGPELAELLSLPQITGARALRLDEGRIYAERESDEGYDEVECRLPALVTCAERLISPIKLPQGIRDPGTVQQLALEDLRGDAADYGALGSPTFVGEARFLPSARKAARLYSADLMEEAAQEVATLIAHTNQVAQDNARPTIGAEVRISMSGRDVWIVCESDSRNELTSVTLELVGNAARLAARTGGAVCALVTGMGGSRFGKMLGEYGVDRVYWLCLDAAQAYSPEVMAAAVAPLVLQHCPWGLLVPATERGRDWAPRLAAQLGLGLTGDAVGLEVDGDMRLVALKPAFGGSLVAEIFSKTRPQMATVRPGVFPLPLPLPGRRAELVRVDIDGGQPLTRLLASHSRVDHSMARLDGASIVIGIGMGIGHPENVKGVLHLARLIGASVCGTRRVCDMGWLPRQAQVGLTGKCLTARLYIALGVRGAPNHTCSLKQIDKLVAVNNDREAPIFRDADLGIVGDCMDFARLLNAIAECNRLKQDTLSNSTQNESSSSIVK